MSIYTKAREVDFMMSDEPNLWCLFLNPARGPLAQPIPQNDLGQTVSHERSDGSRFLHLKSINRWHWPFSALCISFNFEVDLGFSRTLLVFHASGIASADTETTSRFAFSFY